MSTAKDREQFVSKMRELFPDKRYEAEKAARLLLRHAKTHGRLSEMSCNGHPAQGSPTLPIQTINKLQGQWDAYIEKREPQIENRIRQIASELGLSVKFGGDPRGFTVRVFFPDESYNTWGGKEEGYGIPQ